MVDMPAWNSADNSANRCFSHTLIVPANASSLQPKPQASGPAAGPRGRAAVFDAGYDSGHLTVDLADASVGEWTGC
jgi:hypothetical protein